MHATEAAFCAAQGAVRIFGAAGYAAEVGIERYLRDATAPIIYEGMTQIHKMLQAEHALGSRSVNGRAGGMSPLVAWRPGAPPNRAAAPPSTSADAATPSEVTRSSEASAAAS